MKALEIIEKTREYLDYLEDHIKNVQKAWEVVQVTCSDMEFMSDEAIYRRLSQEVRSHDLSKFSSFEFTAYRRHFFPTEEEVCKKTIYKPLFDRAWSHHKHSNLHHWQHWTTFLEDNYTDGEWKIYCVHMVIDWMAMGYSFGDTARQYYEKNKKKIAIPEFAIPFMYQIFDRIGG